MVGRLLRRCLARFAQPEALARGRAVAGMWRHAQVAKVLYIYICVLIAAVGLFALAATLTAAFDCGDWPCGFFRFAIRLVAFACAVGTWGAAVVTFTMHRIAWPLWLNLTLIVVATTVFAITVR